MLHMALAADPDIFRIPGPLQDDGNVVTGDADCHREVDFKGV